MFIIANKHKRGSSVQGFTLVELLIAMVLSALVFAGIFSAYIFMARNLTRLANFEQQQVQNRRVLFQLAKDVGNATQLTTQSVGTLVMTVSWTPVISPTTGTIPPSATETVTYIYDSTQQILTRQDVTLTTTTTTTLLANLTGLTFSYYPPSPSSPKQIGLSYTSAVGDPANGTQSSDAVVSARLMLRNKTTTSQ